MQAHHNPTVRTRGSDRVSLVCAIAGLASFLLLPFATVRHSRIATGVELFAWRALPPVVFGVVIAAWLALAVLAWRRGGRPAAAARGLLGASLIGAMIALSGWTASHVGPSVGPFARVSIGGGAWISAIAAYAAVLTSRRQLGRRSVAGMAIAALAPAVFLVLLASGYLRDLGIMKEYVNVQDRFWVETLNTVIYAGVSVVMATTAGVLLGITAYRRARLERPIFGVVSAFQTVPGIAMVGLLVAPLAAVSFALPWLRTVGVGGLGWAPVVIALTLYALLAIVRNTHAGLRGVDVTVVDAGRGMGMTGGQLLREVELPLGMPVLFSGVRTSAVQTIGNATIGAFVGGVTLGRFIFQGLAEQAPDLTMLGAITLVVIALVVDGVLRASQRLVSRGSRVGVSAAERSGL